MNHLAVDVNHVSPQAPSQPAVGLLATVALVSHPCPSTRGGLVDLRVRLLPMDAL